ncbi:hypothetical protein LTR10_023424 [Elasticomyces elasticus]|uniref:NAD(P)-binding protein n=1 Tax=Exophiala sideris TaxID=1016849 RepID=A0ABR0J644_9EURO|nr:hypothetical protein LTR10_023424 [Elasticomyces elasticus]KAK5028292.1 hypothetical protein LTS07_006383 [Exophiala sideris]KAK5036063.1 hypothetical protein LTR13_005633 [Exophiala sideris]KAK5057100.1 hypothetical protein LTR69_007738 [Exophiala sideris]KAK5181507.1 hypothetical protein LTR44_006302 [Eurotiomycetes sp. CCFEE 6388]
MPTYVITGANRGLGVEFVRQLSSNSSNTVIAAVRSLQGDLDDLKKLSSQVQAKVHVLECNTGDIKSIHKFGEDVKQVLGGKQIDYLLNNAGINSTPDQTSLDITAESLREHIDVNVAGPAETVKTLLPQLGKGSVVMNMTSGLGSCGKKLPKCTTYSISKAAVNMLTVHQSEQLKDRGIQVICMDPGWVKTRMGGEGAILEPHVSIGGMLKTLHNLQETDSGKFYTYTGEEVPW